MKDATSVTPAERHATDVFDRYRSKRTEYVKSLETFGTLLQDAGAKMHELNETLETLDRQTRIVMATNTAHAKALREFQALFDDAAAKTPPEPPRSRLDAFLGRARV